MREPGQQQKPAVSYPAPGVVIVQRVFLLTDSVEANHLAVHSAEILRLCTTVYRRITRLGWVYGAGGRIQRQKRHQEEPGTGIPAGGGRRKRGRGRGRPRQRRRR